MKNVIDGLEQQGAVADWLVSDLDSSLLEDGHPDLVLKPDELRRIVTQRASRKAGFIIAVARSRMMAAFGDGAEALALLKPHVLETNESAATPR